MQQGGKNDATQEAYNATVGQFLGPRPSSASAADSGLMGSEYTRGTKEILASLRSISDNLRQVVLRLWGYDPDDPGQVANPPPPWTEGMGVEVAANEALQRISGYLKDIAVARPRSMTAVGKDGKPVASAPPPQPPAGAQEGGPPQYQPQQEYGIFGVPRPQGRPGIYNRQQGPPPQFVGGGDGEGHEGGGMPGEVLGGGFDSDQDGGGFEEFREVELFDAQIIPK